MSPLWDSEKHEFMIFLFSRVRGGVSVTGPYTMQNVRNDKKIHEEGGTPFEPHVIVVYLTACDGQFDRPEYRAQIDELRNLSPKSKLLAIDTLAELASILPKEV